MSDSGLQDSKTVTRPPLASPSTSHGPGTSSKKAAPLKAKESAAPAVKETADDDRLKRAKLANDRFKRRGKRQLTATVDEEDKTDETNEASASKKLRSDERLTPKPESRKDADDEYLKEVRKYDTSLKDSGAGKRPLVR
ncbi:MAG: hypothetical protein CYPHOPRED_002507 [Cyphobasidiales sp. Tagirdzhanova-0007]|nr:MAG: hypothetical protein CYPHOPRED_002507 [Cyphobasidiales sp. Tagirdzhanova-0007]